ncbi:MAG: CDP-archaeol synthase [Pseudomonadales bacterium]|nr:CDP-archaeol synthase [Pseudomonadales bacterium]
MSDVYNFAQYLVNGCRKHPSKTALSIPVMEGHTLVSEESATFDELLKLVARFQEGLKRENIGDGDRVIIIVKPTLDLYALIVACFCSGVIPVFVDTGMGKKKIIMALEDSKAKAIVSSKLLLKLFWAIKPLRGMKRYTVDGVVPFCSTDKSLKPPVIGCPITIKNRKPTDHCLITFTSGSTGRPKGADRTHDCLINQHLALENSSEYLDSDYGMSCFPVAALHLFACGVPTALPRVDLAKIGDVNAPLIIEQINEFNINFIGSAPAFINGLISYLEENNEKLSHIRIVVIGGSTVPTELLKRARVVFPNAEINVVYGSTESEPISHISCDEILKEPDDKGYLVGKPVDECEVKIVDAICKPISNEEELLNLECEPNQPGEIVVSGGHVLREYIDNPDATKESKIKRKNGSVWHRTGDYGFKDEQSRIWLAGRDKDLIRYNDQYLSNYCIEKKLDALEGIERAAILSTEKGISVVVESSKAVALGLKPEIEGCCAPINGSDIAIYAVDLMPVDGRHNSKIDRPTLKTKINDGLLRGVDQAEELTSTSNQKSLKEEWQTPNRKLILKGVGVLSLVLLLFGSSGFTEGVGFLALSLYVQVPVVIGGVLHMVVVTRDMWPSMKVPIWESQFGKNKTWRGIVVVPILTLIGVVPLLVFEAVQQWVFGNSLLAEYSLVLLGIMGGLGYMLGELPNSFLKRRMGAAPGEMPTQNENFFIALDQIDSAVGVALLFWLFLGFPITVCLLYAATFPVTALVVKHYLYKYKLKDMAR